MLSKILFIFVLFIFIKNLIKIFQIQNTINKGPVKKQKSPNSNVFDAEYTVIKEENS